MKNLIFVLVLSSTVFVGCGSDFQKSGLVESSLEAQTQEILRHRKKPEPSPTITPTPTFPTSPTPMASPLPSPTPTSTPMATATPTSPTLSPSPSASPTPVQPRPTAAPTANPVIPDSLTNFPVPERWRVQWKPGVTHNGGMPNRTVIFKSLKPVGGSADDTPQIQAALDSCPENQVVYLSAGTYNIFGEGLNFRTSNCTLRGAGPGAGSAIPSNGSGPGVGTGTYLWKADYKTNPNFGVLYVNKFGSPFGASYNLASDALKGSQTLTLSSTPTGLSVGQMVLLDIITNNHPDVYWGLAHDPPGGGSRRWFIRQDRSITQILKITAIAGNSITFETPFSFDFKVMYQAQITTWTGQWLKGVGVEDIYIFGGRGGDGNGNLAVFNCELCWVKHVESHWSEGTGISFNGTYRSELRDSYIHESAWPYPGGGGYLTGLNSGASDNLFENNIMWAGNKNIVVRATGGGNVIAYNYMDDGYGGNYPSLGEAGLNAGHYTTPHMELLEGNYSPNFKGDSFWGNSIYITVYRNHLSAIRAAAGKLATYSYFDGNCLYPYKDLENRFAVDITYSSFYNALVGNILGKQDQAFLSYSSTCYSVTQNKWLYENLLNFPPDGAVVMWNLGSQQNPNDWKWFANTYQTVLRQGNFDWVTKQQTWYAQPLGASGSGGALAQNLPDSLYLSSKPAFFGSRVWPWVDPATGITYTLPAKARFDAGSPNLVP